MATEHYIEIKTVGKISADRTFRFYGLGHWKEKRRTSWQVINAIYVPARALEVAAANCSPKPPILSERDIAQLCGGR